MGTFPFLTGGFPLLPMGIFLLAKRVGFSLADENDRLMAQQADRQGIGLSRLPEEE